MKRNILVIYFVLLLMDTIHIYILSAQDPEILNHGDVELEYAPSLKIVEINSSKPFKIVVTEDFARKHEIKLKVLGPTFSAKYLGARFNFKKFIYEVLESLPK